MKILFCPYNLHTVYSLARLILVLDIDPDGSDRKDEEGFHRVIFIIIWAEMLVVE